MKNFGEILDVVTLILSILCIALAISDKNWGAICGWTASLIWQIRCMKSELKQ